MFSEESSGWRAHDGPLHVVGADRDPTQLAKILEAGISVVVVGTQGSGKSFLCAAVVEKLREREHDPLLLHGVRALQSVRFGAVTVCEDDRALPLLGAVDLESSQPSARRQSPIPILVIDDAEYLDDATTDSLLRVLYKRFACALIFMTPSETTQHDSAASRSRHAFTELWSSGMARRLDLTDLTKAEADALIATFIGTTDIDSVTQASLQEWSGGSRLILRELCMLATQHEDDHFPAAREPQLPAIADTVRHQLSNLPQDAGTALALIARIRGISYARASRVIRPTTVAALISIRLIIESGYPVRRLYVNPAVSMVAHSIVADEEVERLLDEVIGRAGEDLGSLAPPGPGIGTELALRWLRGEDAAADPAYRSQVFLSAARSATSTGEHDLAGVFAREALGGGFDAQAIAIMAFSLLSTGNVSAASALLREWTIDKKVEEHDNVLALWTAVAVSLPSADAVDLVESHLRINGDLSPADTSILNAGRALTALMELRLDEALEVALTTMNSQTSTGTARLTSALTAAVAATLNNSWSTAIECLALADQFNRDPVTGRIRNAQTAAAAACVETICRVLTGVSVDAINAKVSQLMTNAVVSDDRLVLSVLSWITATLSYFHGDLRRARTDIAASERRVRIIVPQVAQAIRAQRAMILRALGEHDAADNLADALSSEAARPLLKYLIRRAQMTSPHSTETFAPTGVPMLDIHDSYRAGLIDPPKYADLLDGLVVDSRGAFTRAMADHVRGLADADADRLMAAGLVFEELGAFDQAAKAFAAASEIEADQGHKRASAVAAARAGDARMHTGASAESTTFRPPAAVLTPREYEIVTLVAQGHSDKQIAADLFLSVRTVESHLYQARAKLGVPSRRDLVDVLGFPES
ncbi:DNA-binding CsgD family transcriptional regulator [Microbacterium halimionae]|uniref:DNA-binding CsgD family transcriptional regulator n=1 Tax=Microbacterium halimionae TaxID=1526413 RepID=A0A7W3JMR5_9MICO|nr:LuxR C-terminal-related transcriptional regulator [Microbacterium halimionae]MBA8815675.1 DNA-binding CsgD family transcriptional regulator [Microbacterium halimionae]NII95721.1 DNA-binding CsgD family transcriptional regulator [Microbacterium halimionae]